MPFDPSQPFDVIQPGASSNTTPGGFDPSQPFEVVEEGRKETPPLGFLNRGIASVVGAPADLSASIWAGLTGRDITPLGGRKTIESGMQAIGIGLPEEGQKPQTLGEHIQRGIGETAGALLPMGAASRAAQALRGTSTGARVLQSMGSAYGGRGISPAAPLAADLALGATSGGGGYAAKQMFPDNPNAEIYGELAGGFAPLAALGAGKAAAKYGPTGLAVRTGARAIAGAVAPFTRQGGMVRAERRVQGLVADPGKTAQALGEPTISDLTAAQRSGEPRLMALEQEVLNTSPQLEGEFAERTAGNVERLRAELRDIAGKGTPQDTREYIEGRRTRLLQALDTRARQAADLAEQKVAQIAPQDRPSQASVIVREEIEKAYGAHKGQESHLWADVPKDTTVGTENVRARFDEIMAELPRAQVEDVPEIAQRFLTQGSNNFIGAENSVNEVWGLRSKLLEASRQARAAGKGNEARIADDLADALLDDLGARAGNIQGEAGEKLRLALDYTREGKRIFNQGAVGRILATAREGGPRIDPRMTLDATLGQRGTAGAVAGSQIVEAAPAQPVQDAMRQFVLNRIPRDPGRAREFVEANPDLFDQFPDLRKQVRETADLMEAAQALGRRSETVGRLLSQRSKSYTADFLGSGVDQEIERVVASKNPAQFAQQLRQLVRRDTTGRALEGLKAGFVDYLMNKAGGNVGDVPLSGRKFLALMGDNRVRPALMNIFSPQEMRRLEQVGREFSRIEASQGRLPAVGGVMNDIPSSILSLAARTLAARHGATLGAGTSGASLLTAGYFSKRAQQLLGNLTNDKAAEIIKEAVRDPELMRILLTNTTTKANRRVAAQRFNAWLAGPGARLFGDDQ